MVLLMTGCRRMGQPIPLQLGPLRDILRKKEEAEYKKSGTY